MAQDKNLTEALKNARLFSGVSKRGIAALSGGAVYNRYRGGTVIFSEGEEGSSLHIIAKGTVKIVKHTKEGRSKTLAILKECDSFGEMAILTKEARSATVEALTDADTVSIAKEFFEEAIMKEPSISLEIIKTLSERLARADRDIKNLALGSAKGRIACVITDFKEAMNSVKFTHQDIAELAGLTRETTTRILKQMEEEKLIRFEKKKIKISDEKKMKELCL